MTTDTTFTNVCLPWAAHNYTIFPYWDDLYLVNSASGIFTSVSGTAPNRIFNIEWRAQYFPGSGSANFELRLYEGQSRFDVIYGTVDSGNTSATAGVQKNTAQLTQYFCNGSGGAATGGQSYTLQPCGTPSPTPTATPTATGSPSCTPGPVILQGSIDDTEPFHNSVNGAVSSCAVSPACPGELAGEFHYDTYQLTNPSSNPTCITVTTE